MILEKINQTVEPCDDFYQFVCGKFLQETEIPDEDVSVTTFNAIYDKVQMQLRFVLNQPATADDIRPVAIAKNSIALASMSKEWKWKVLRRSND